LRRLEELNIWKKEKNLDLVEEIKATSKETQIKMATRSQIASKRESEVAFRKQRPSQPVQLD
jgi:hypothetical protein